MADSDVFERSLAGAFLRLADDVPGAVDAAAVAHRVALEHPRQPGAAGRLRLVAIPRLAWVLLLLGALLAALVGGMLVAGSQPARRLSAVLPPIGTTYTCPAESTPDKPGPVDQARPLTPQTVAFDRRAGRLVAVTNARDGVETWTFDVCTNTWTQMHPTRKPPSFEWAQLVYDIDSDMTILASGEAGWATPQRVWAYDLQADAWAEKAAAPTDNAAFLAYDPVSGLVVAGDSYRKELWNYDVEKDTWAPIHQENVGPDYRVIAYDASVDRLVADGGGADGGNPYETWLFDIRTGTWSKASAETPDVIEVLWVSPGIAYDEAAERTVAIGDVRWAAYDAAQDRWEILFEAEDPSVYLPTVYDPVNGRLVSIADGAGVAAFDMATRRWTVLLDPGTGWATP